MSGVDVPGVVDRLSRVFQARYPTAASLAATDPAGALEHVDDVVVEWKPGRSGGACPVDGAYVPGPPASITIHSTGNVGRDNFTYLHELGHHILANDEEWQYRTRPELGNRARHTEETVVNSFAARELIPEELFAAHVPSAVTAGRVRGLYLASSASASACLMRALDAPGHRLVMLTDLQGTTWFSESTGEPFSPGPNVPQPGVADAIRQADDADGIGRVAGGHGITYRSGRTNPWVEIDVAVHESMAFVVAHPVTRDSRTPGGGTWNLTCGECGHTYAPDDSAGFCQECREHRCSQCRACACDTKPAVVCTRCFIALSVAEAASGRQQHDDCS